MWLGYVIGGVIILLVLGYTFKQAADDIFITINEEHAAQRADDEMLPSNFTNK